jgi:hypothetical protein
MYHGTGHCSFSDTWGVIPEPQVELSTEVHNMLGNEWRCGESAGVEKVSPLWLFLDQKISPLKSGR